MKILLVFFIFIFIPTSSFSADFNRYVRCLSANAKNGGKINLMYVDVSYDKDNWSSNYVKYEKSSKPITLIPVSIKAVDDGTKSNEITIKWKELVDGAYLGEYSMVSQGVYIGKFTYQDKSGNLFSFQDNPELLSADRETCNWRVNSK